MASAWEKKIAQTASKILLAAKEHNSAHRAAVRGATLSPGDLSFMLIILACQEYDKTLEKHGSAAEWTSVIAPGDFRSCLYLGLSKYQAGFQHVAGLSFRKALILEPSKVQAMTSNVQFLLASSNFLLGKSVAARLTILEPNSAESWKWLSRAEAGLHRLDAYLACSERAIELSENPSVLHSHRIFVKDHIGSSGFAGEQSDRREWWRRYGSVLRPFVGRTDAHRRPGQKLSIGYVSGDFSAHSVGFVMSSILEHHDRTKFNIFLYSNNDKRDLVTDLIRSQDLSWRDVHNVPDEAVFNLIKSDKIDILVDLSGHSPRNRLPLFARRAAPVQVTAWGYANGTGIQTIDYLLTDPAAIPIRVRHLFAEKCLDLPCIIPCPDLKDAPPVSALPAEFNSYVTFGSLNRWSKLTETTMMLWGAVLRALPDAVFFLKSGELSYLENRELLLGRLKAQGIDRRRILFDGETSRHDHLQAFGRIDICLDTAPQTGGVTSWEAAYMGVPVVTMTGESVSHRVSDSIMRTLGLDGCVAQNEREYVEAATKLAGDLPALAQLRRRLRKRILASSAGNLNAYVGAIEDAYLRMWLHFQETDL